MATEYGGAYGEQPWRDAEPQYPGQPMRSDDQPRHGAQQPGPLPPGGQRRRASASTVIAVTALALGLIGLVISLIGVATQLLPRTFTAAQQRQITDWEYGKHWRTLSAGEIFPASVNYQAPAVLDADPPVTLSARRVGIARQATCRAAADAAAAAILDRNGCSAMLRATYTDSTDSYVVTVGVAVLPSATPAEAAFRELAGAADVGGIAPGVHAVPVSGTAAAWFTNQRRQLSGSLRLGPYVALYTVGYADSRPWEPVPADKYADGEMTSVGSGVAEAVLAKIGEPVAVPHCPGTPGCLAA